MKLTWKKSTTLLNFTPLHKDNTIYHTRIYKLCTCKHTLPFRPIETAEVIPGVSLTKYFVLKDVPVVSDLFIVLSVFSAASPDTPEGHV